VGLIRQTPKAHQDPRQYLKAIFKSDVHK